MIPIRALSPSDERAWRDLATRSVEPNPFYEADFLVPACRHLRGGERAVLLVAEDDGRLHACLPLRSGLRRWMPSPLVMSPWRHLYCFLGTPLVAPERAIAALSALLTSLRSAARSGIVVFESFAEDGPTASLLRSAASSLGLVVHVHSSAERAVLRCADESTTVVRSARSHRSKARQWRRLRVDLGDPVVVDRAGDEAGATRFLAMEAEGWKGRAGTALACRAGDAAFYRELAARFGAAGRLRLYSLEVDDAVLAMQNSLYADHWLFDWKVAYDERYARYGPGTQLQLRVMELAAEERLRGIDSCADGNAEQLHLYPHRRRIATLTVGKPGVGPKSSALAVACVKIDAELRTLSKRTLRRQLDRVSALADGKVRQWRA